MLANQAKAEGDLAAADLLMVKSNPCELVEMGFATTDSCRAVYMSKQPKKTSGLTLLTLPVVLLAFSVSIRSFESRHIPRSLLRDLQRCSNILQTPRSLPYCRLGTTILNPRTWQSA